MKRLLPAALAALVFVFALLWMQPEELVPLVAAAADLPAGHVLQPADLQLLELPKSLAPEGAFSDPAALIGQRLKIARTAGDLIYPSHLGGEQITLAPDERAVAIRVTDSGGLAGLLKPGDRVGLTAVLADGAGSGTFGKAVIGGLRVLYVSPSFQAEDPPAEPDSTGQGPSANEGTSQDTFSASNTGSSTQRQDSGTVVLAVPVGARVVRYDWAVFGVDDDARLIYAVDLLPALDQAANAKLALYLEPEQPLGFVSSGIYLPDLARTPGPSPTPTETPVGYVAATPVPVLPGVTPFPQLVPPTPKK